MTKERKNSFRVRAGQREFERGVELHRICALLARRQYGKTTICARISLKKMMRTAGHTVVFGSVKLDLGREIVRKEAAELQKAFGKMAQQAEAANNLLDVVDDRGQSVAKVSADDYAELYESSRLEMRLYHSKSVYSRTKVVALTSDAVGETGDLILDEVGRVKKFRDVVEAVTPIIASNPDFRLIYTTTPPPDDTHYSFDLLAPPIAGELPINPKGNWYRSDLGVWVLRVTAWDAHADGVPLYDDDTGAEITPEQSRASSHDKDAWDRNYGCKFVVGGTSACGLLQLDSAQRRGLGQCAYFRIDSDADLDLALRFLVEHLTSGPVGLGWDLATTTKATSNPSSLAVVEGHGNEKIIRAIINWKVSDPAVAVERVRRIAQAVKLRREGGPARRLCIDATNERYFAQAFRNDLADLVPVELVIASETVEVPGQDDPITRKQLLGGNLVAELDDNHLWLPPERFVREDWRLVKKEKGQFVCEPDAEGRHGDTFDGAKLGLEALTSTKGAIESTAGWAVGSNHRHRAQFTPRRLARRLA
ncbi:MAG TPA: hypothetical protein VHB20_14620 [Verrucomicrobiae bacterium]|nr:hypothetical protein [Verrucomicrobiae bacterium]